MHDDRSLAEARLRRTISDRIRPSIHQGSAPLEIEAWHVPGPVTDAVPTATQARRALADGLFEPFRVGDAWGRPWGTVWFHLVGRAPSDWEGRTVELAYDTFPGVGAGFQSEAMLYPTADDGRGPLRGMHPMHQFVPIDIVAHDGVVDVLVEAAANPIIGTSHRATPLGDPDTAGDSPLYRLHRAELVCRNDAVWHLDLDLQIFGGLMRTMATDDPRRFEILRVLDAAMDEFDPHEAEASAANAREVLAPLHARVAADSAHRTSAIGHAHIDSAWLWPLRETRRKCARTFASAVTLMDDDPTYRFACSQAAQYDWIEHDQPELFERIRAKVAEGRFVPVGAMWVEADANLPSGESLARQFVWGTRYFADRFGIDAGEAGNRTCWIPDVFGYAGNLPQIMSEAGCDSFLTQKLSWNQTNDFPHHTFRWEGIDGTRVLTHFPPVDTYNGEVTPKELAFSVTNFRDKGRSSRSMYLFGHGDGGGGPTREMLQRAHRVSGPAGAGLDGLPRLAIETPERFFDAVRDEYPDAPVWRGELYFEMHRGTYTSQAKTKWGNRRGELAFRELELWTAPGGDRADAPLDDLERLWKVLLLHQFHDIIPGSSIAWVHDDTEAAHAALLAEVEDRVASAVQTFGETSGASTGDGGLGVVAYNASPFPVATVVDVGDADGAVGPTVAIAPAHGVGVVTSDRPEAWTPVVATAFESTVVPGTTAAVEMANGLVRVRIGEDGTIASFVALAHGADERECLSGPANVLQLFRDLPNTYDAWDIDQHTLSTEPTLVTGLNRVELVQDHPLRAAVRVRRWFGSSEITQTYVLRAGSARLDIETDVDWRENEMLLKVAFPLDLRADDARFDVQYGHVRRPTHRNTSWDAARFEVCGHFWADVSEPDFGVALLNDGKYGHDVVGDDAGTTIRLSLLRAPNYPDPDADRGRHRFTYALMPHGPTLAPVLAEAWALNQPLRLGPGQPRDPIVSVDHPGVVVTAVKAADDGSGDLIVRAHEALGGRAFVSFSFADRWTTATPCDLAEVPVADAFPLDDGQLAWELRPFKLVTLRLTR